jgi:2-phospho-L-lactate guanylyltransferase (CobY/MobA/RfbA family)
MSKLGYDILLIALGVLIPAALVAGPRLHKKIRSKRLENEERQKFRDETLQQVACLLKELSGDVKCLFTVSESQLEALEVTLLALKGEHLNGNVSDALKKIREAKMHLSGRLVAKIGDCPDIGSGAD